MARLSSAERQSPQPNSTGSFPAPFLAQLRPIVEALPDLAFESAFGRIVELLARQRVRKIVLSRESFILVMIVGVAAAIAFRLHQLGRRVENVLGRQQRTRL